MGAFSGKGILNIYCVLKFKVMVTVELLTTETFKITSETINKQVLSVALMDERLIRPYN